MKVFCVSRLSLPFICAKGLNKKRNEGMGRREKNRIKKIIIHALVRTQLAYPTYTLKNSIKKKKKRSHHQKKIIHT